MPKKVDAYQCEVCEAYFVKESEAVECEEFHTKSDNLKLGDIFYKRDVEFPHIVTVYDESGHGALYTMTMEGSVEDVWENFQSTIRHARFADDDEGY